MYVLLIVSPPTIRYAEEDRLSTSTCYAVCIISWGTKKLTFVHRRYSKIIPRNNGNQTGNMSYSAGRQCNYIYRWITQKGGRKLNASSTLTFVYGQERIGKPNWKDVVSCKTKLATTNVRHFIATASQIN